MEPSPHGRQRSALCAGLSALAGAASLAAAIVAGPVWMYAASGAGLLLSFAALWWALRIRGIDRPVILPSILGGVHVLLLVLAAVLSSMFLAPLPAALAKMPRLQRPYAAANGVFEVRGPAGWTYRPLPSAFETGVRLQPSAQSHYMGVSEATIFVRKLDAAPASPEAFLETAAESFSKNKEGRRLFDLTTERGTSLSGAPIMWSKLTVKRLWVPLYQISVFGVKNGRYLCSVSATGLKSHSALSRVLCLGLFERIKITEKRER